MQVETRVAVVTGANSGIGRQVARQLAKRGTRAVLACRNVRAGERAAARIRSRGGVAEVAVLDLASLASIRSFAQAWDGPLELLVNNAGVMAPPRLQTTVDGFERQWGVNHLGHFVLTALLLPALERAGGRVVTVSSIAHHRGTELVLDANLGELYHARRAYSNSKLANLLFADHLQRELTAHGSAVTSTAAHPGISATGLFSSRDGMGGGRLGTRLFAPIALRLGTQSAAAGARPVIFAAAGAEPGSYSGPRWFGETRGPVGPARRSLLAQDETLARRLWDVSEELSGVRFAWDAGPR